MNKQKIGIVGTGFIGRGLAMALDFNQEMILSRVLTRRRPDTIPEHPRSDCLTQSLNELLEYSDLIVECSGDVRHATQVVSAALEAGLPIVTMNAEFHVTTGSFFADKGLLTEAQGDQPGCLAALNQELLAMGFQPKVFGNVKGFINRNPTRSEMLYWAQKQGISLAQVTAFTDGTKVEIEQILVANGLGADLLPGGLTGITCKDLETGSRWLKKQADLHHLIVSDYLLLPNTSAHIFIVATHQDPRQQPYLKYLKQGDGPDYLFTRNYHLCHLEILKSIKAIWQEKKILLNNNPQPRYSVAAVAKQALKPGDHIAKGIGSFELRGKAIALDEIPHHLPIGLADEIRLTRKIAEGEILCLDDVEIPDSLALDCWLKIQERRNNTATLHGR